MALPLPGVPTLLGLGPDARGANEEIYAKNTAWPSARTPRTYRAMSLYHKDSLHPVPCSLLLPPSSLLPPYSASLFPPPTSVLLPLSSLIPPPSTRTTRERSVVNVCQVGEVQMVCKKEGGEVVRLVNKDTVVVIKGV